MVDTSTSRLPPRWRDFVEVLYKPSAVFARNSGGIFWVPLAVVVLLMWSLLILAVPLYQPILDEILRVKADVFLRRYPFAGPSAVEAERALAERFSMVIAPLLLCFVIAGMGVVGWLAGRIGGARQSIRSAFQVVGFATMPVVIGLIVMLVELAMSSTTMPEAWTLARLFNSAKIPEPFLSVISIDVFFIWASILFAAGLAVTGRVTRARALTIVASIWLARTAWVVISFSGSA